MYATEQDMTDRFGATELVQLTDRTNKPRTTIDSDVVALAIGDAEALADGYLGKVYALPLVQVPPVLTKVVCDIARYYLHGKSAEKDGPVLRAHNEATAWLRDVSRGLVVLDVGGEAPAQTGGGSVRTSGPERVFTRDSLCGY